MKKTLRSIFLSVGLGTMIFLPMLILDNGLNDTLKSVLIWTGASVLYGLSFELFKTKLKLKTPLHILICFAITITVRCLYSYFTAGTVNFFVILVTIPIFIAVYIALYFFMKYIGDLDVQ
ncbi:MAG: DUF3021 family protein [Oscillospiraceae bacterium]|nr:DUF3021 family protein [Oscillospiraceae bacterium]